MLPYQHLIDDHRNLSLEIELMMEELKVLPDFSEEKIYLTHTVLASRKKLLKLQEEILGFIARDLDVVK